MIKGFGLNFDGTLNKQSWSSLYTYKFQSGCSAELTISGDECSPQITEGLGYVNETWCDNKRKYKLSARCPGQSISSIKSSIISDQFNLTQQIPVYLPSKIAGITFEIDEAYDWGTMSLVYTNHGKYPLLKGSVQVSGRDVFCADPACKQAYVMIDHPAKYVILSTDSDQRTAERMAKFIQDNIERVYKPDFSPLNFMSDAYAYNRGVRVCYYPYGLMRAEKSKVDWLRGIFITDMEFNRIYWPFTFYYDPAVWSKSDVIGTQMDLITGEFSFAKKMSEPGKYQLCTSEQIQNCAEACSAENVLAIDKCPTAGSPILQAELPSIVSVFGRLYNSTSYRDPFCLILFDSLGEVDITGMQSTGYGTAVLKLDKGVSTLYLIALKGNVNVQKIESILERKYSIQNMEVTRVSTQGDCIEYRYKMGYAAVCDYHDLSFLAFSYCERVEDCKPVIDEAIQIINA